MNGEKQSRFEKTKPKPKGFLQWCLANPEIVVAAFCLSIGLVVSCS